MKTNSRLLHIITILYIYIPVCIFFFGFTKWYISVPVTGVICFFGYKMFTETVKTIKTKEICIPLWLLFILIIVTCTLTIIMGYGNLFEQPGDWLKHNAVIQDLVLKDWPVYYTKYDDCMLTYYVGQYLFPCLIGKICGSVRLAEILMAVCGLAGIILVYLNLVRATGSNTVKKQIVAFILLFFFCGALLLAQAVTKGIYGDDMYCDWQMHWILAKGHMLQYRSNYVMLSWVYPQVIVPWLIVIIFYENYKRISHYVLLIAPVLLYGSFNIISFAYIAIAACIYILITSRQKKSIVADILSTSNVVTFVTLGTVLIAYFSGFLFSKKPGILKLRIEKYTIEDMWVLVIFLFFMFGIYAICIFKESKDILFIASITGLVIIPFFTMGLHNDWVMGVSIPLLFILMIKVIVFLNTDNKSASMNYRCGIISICLIIGAWYPVMEIKESLISKANGYKYVAIDESLEESTELSNDHIAVDMKYNYYNYNLENDLFYNYFARKKIND